MTADQKPRGAASRVAIVGPCERFEHETCHHENAADARGENTSILLRQLRRGSYKLANQRIGACMPAVSENDGP